MSQPLFSRLSAARKKLMVLIAGILSGAAIPVWQIYFVDTPDLSIEVSTIAKINLDEPRISLSTDELKELETYIPDALRYEYDARGIKGDKIDYPLFRLTDLQKAFEKAQKDLRNISHINNSLGQYQSKIASMLSSESGSEDINEFRIVDLKEWNLRRYIDDSEAIYYEDQLLELTRGYSRMQYADNGEAKINTQGIRMLLNDVREDLHDVMIENHERLAILKDDMSTINNQLSAIRDSEYEEQSLFNVELVINNSGRANTSIKPQALMRVAISKSHYADVYLYVEDYKDNAEIKANSTKIIRYTSRKIATLPKDDQQLLQTFWRSTASFRVFVMANDGSILSADSVAFSDSVNDKAIFDQLREQAHQY